MPSPRAVLADIHDLKLDPTVAHTGVKASGRLAVKHAGAPVEESVSPAKDVEAVDEKPVKNALVELKAETKVEAEPAPKKPQPPKKAKKEKTEDVKAEETKPEEQ